MSNNVLEGLIKEKDYNFKKFFFKIVFEYKLSLNELILIIYFSNQDNLEFDINKIKDITFLDKTAILESYSLLTTKNLLSIDIVKNSNGKVSELINLDNLYKAIVSDIKIVNKKNIENRIFDLFEKEFGRPLSPYELEVMNAWLKSGINDELIVGALNEATYNGVRNLRYIDKIIYEWGKKGFKTMADVKKHLTNKKEEKKQEREVLFEYNWLDDEE